MNAIRNFSACNGMIQLLYLTKASMQDTILEDVKELLIDCMMSDKALQDQIAIQHFRYFIKSEK